MLISTALLLDSNIRNSVCTPAKLPCRRVEVGYGKIESLSLLFKLIVEKIVYWRRLVVKNYFNMYYVITNYVFKNGFIRSREETKAKKLLMTVLKSNTT
jgi:hypothetical protein